MTTKARRSSARPTEDIPPWLEEVLKAYAADAKRVGQALAEAMARAGSIGPEWLGSSQPGRIKRSSTSAMNMFATDRAWKLQALPRIEEGLAKAFPSGEPALINSQGRLALWCLDFTWNHYKRGAAALLFDVGRFVTRFGLPLPSVFAAEMMMLSLAVLSDQKIVAKGEHADMIESHRKALVCRLRYEHVVAVLQSERREGKSQATHPNEQQRTESSTTWAAGPTAWSNGEPATKRSLQDGVAFLRCCPAELHDAVHFEFSVDHTKYLPADIKEAVRAAIPQMRSVARPGGIDGWDTIYRNYMECKKAADGHRIGDPLKWPGRYALPSRRTCELLGWEELFAAYDALGVRPDDPYHMMLLGVVTPKNGTNYQTFIRRIMG